MVMLKRSLAKPLEMGNKPLLPMGRDLDRGQQGAEKLGKSLTSFRVFSGVFRFLYASALVLCYTAGGCVGWI